MNRTSEKWKRLKEKLCIGDKIQGKVVDVQPYGVFVDIGFQIENGFNFAGIIDIASTSKLDFHSLSTDKTTWPCINENVECVVIAYRENSFEVDLGLCTKNET
jgi:ribosomal protein S1